MDAEPGRTETISIKLTSVERAEITQAAKLSGSTPSGWCRTLVLAAARGERTEVRSDKLEWLKALLDRIITLQLETLRTVHEHTGHTSPTDELRARQAAAEKMDRALQALGFTDGDEK